MIVALFPADSEEVLFDALAFAGTSALPLDHLSEDRPQLGDADLVVVDISEQPMRRLRGISRIAETLGIPVLVVADADTLALIEISDDVSDFITKPVDPIELKMRINRLTHGVATDEKVVFKDLELNPLTYQALLAGEPMNLTFMEYGLLRFLLENPARVWSREQLLSRVWGYDYYGGARTVDVHIRRLRAKLGEERSSWIATVRSVGYRFG